MNYASPFTIRPATEDDITAITEIYNEAVRETTATFDTEPKTLDERSQWFAKLKKHYPILVGELDGQIAGYASAVPWSDKKGYAPTVENSVYVFKKFHNRGLGKALLEKLLPAIREHGFTSVIARITSDNEKSIMLHEKFGFKRVGSLKRSGYKFDRWLDVELLQIHL